jgi:hypothetical protein
MAADYVIITSTPFSFSVTGGGEQDKSFEFTLPSGAKVDSNSILFWTAEFNIPLDEHLLVSFNINTKEVFKRYYYAPISIGSFNTVIAANVLKEAETNDIEFEVQGSNGAVTFGNVYLMIQRGP